MKKLRLITECFRYRSAYLRSYYCHVNLRKSTQFLTKIYGTFYSADTDVGILTIIRGYVLFLRYIVFGPDTSVEGQDVVLLQNNFS